MKIFKYELPVNRGESRLMAYPIEEIMHLEVVAGLPYMWALVDNSRREIEHIVHALHTGEENKHFNVVGTDFIGTAVLEEGDYVLHYYIDEL